MTVLERVGGFTQRKIRLPRFQTKQGIHSYSKKSKKLDQTLSNLVSTTKVSGFTKA